MAFDIYGHTLRPGHCEVHPDVAEPYPCYYCRSQEQPVECCASGRCEVCTPGYEWNLPLHRTEAGYPRCSTCDGGGCLDCTDPA